MLIRGVTLFLYFWVGLLLGAREINLVFTAGGLTLNGVTVLAGLLGATLVGWLIADKVGPRTARVVNVLAAGANLVGLGTLIAGVTRLVPYRDFLLYRPFFRVQVVYPPEVHHRVWSDTFTSITGTTPGEVPPGGATLAATTEAARAAAAEYLARLTPVVTEVTPSAGGSTWPWIVGGVLLGVLVAGGLLLWWGQPPGSPPSPGSPPAPKWWDHPEAAEVRPRSPCNFGIEDVEKLFAEAKPRVVIPKPKGFGLPSDKGPRFPTPLNFDTKPLSELPASRMDLLFGASLEGGPTPAPSGARAAATRIIEGFPAVAARAAAADSIITSYLSWGDQGPPGSRPAGVRTPLSDFPDLPGQAPTGVRAPVDDSQDLRSNRLEKRGPHIYRKPGSPHWWYSQDLGYKPVKLTEDPHRWRPYPELAEIEQDARDYGKVPLHKVPIGPVPVNYFWRDYITRHEAKTPFTPDSSDEIREFFRRSPPSSSDEEGLPTVIIEPTSPVGTDHEGGFPSRSQGDETPDEPLSPREGGSPEFIPLFTAEELAEEESNPEFDPEDLDRFAAWLNNPHGEDYPPGFPPDKPTNDEN